MKWNITATKDESFHSVKAEIWVNEINFARKMISNSNTYKIDQDVKGFMAENLGVSYRNSDLLKPKNNLDFEFMID